MSLIVLMIWINDDPIQGNVMKIGNIVEPRIGFHEYREGQDVKAKCAGFGIQRGIIGKIGDESQRKEFDLLLGGPWFKELVTKFCGETRPSPGDDDQPDGSVISTTPARKRKQRPLPKIDLEEQVNEVSESDSCKDAVEDLSEAEHSDEDLSRPKKAKKKVNDNEAMRAKKEAAKLKRDVSKSREKANQLASAILLNEAETTLSSQDSEMLTSIKRSQETILDMLQQIVQKQDAMEQQLTEMTSCRQCVKSLYRKLKPTAASSPRTPSHKALQPSRCTPAPVIDPVEISTTAAESVDNDIQPESEVGQVTEMPTQQSMENTDELTYLGDSQYGILVNKKRLANCEMASSKIDKLALNILELLITKEECANLSIYGQAKGKDAMAPSKRKALRSHLFKQYGRNLSEEEKENLWSTEIVKKLNDKIRGIKNNKYKL